MTIRDITDNMKIGAIVVDPWVVFAQCGSILVPDALGLLDGFTAVLVFDGVHGLALDWHAQLCADLDVLAFE